MNIQLQSQMPFGNATALGDFFFTHRLVHDQVDAVLSARFGVKPPDATIDSRLAQEAWALAMTHPDQFDEERQRVMVDWLQLHSNLHQSEYAALGFGVSPDLSTADFRQSTQFYDWMYAHSVIHDILNAATGAS